MTTTQARFGRLGVVVCATVWLLALWFHVGDVLNDRLVWTPVYVQKSGDHLAISGFFAAEHSGLLVGDRIVSVGTRTPTSRFEFMSAAVTQQQQGAVAMRVQRAGRNLAFDVALDVVALPLRQTLISLGFGIVAILIATARAPSASSLLFAAAALMYGAQSAYFFGSSAATAALGAGILALTCALYWPLALNAVQTMNPDGPGGWRLLLPWLLTVSGIAAYAWQNGTPVGGPYAQMLALSLNIVCFACGIWTFVATYRRTSRDNVRRSLRWIAFGLACAVLPVVVASVVTIAIPSSFRLYSMSLTFVLLIPICIAAGILRADLFDIDRVVSGTVTYTVVLVIIALILEFGVQPLVTRIATASDVPEQLAHVMFIVAVALLGQPLERRVKPLVDRFFWKDGGGPRHS